MKFRGMTESGEWVEGCLQIWSDGQYYINIDEEGEIMEIEKELNKNEINILIEAVDSWVDKDFSSELMGDLLETMLLPKDSPQEIKNEIKRKRDNQKVEYKKQKELRKEQAIMLKAKLLKIRDGIEASCI